VRGKAAMPQSQAVWSVSTASRPTPPCLTRAVNHDREPPRNRFPKWVYRFIVISELVVMAGVGTGVGVSTESPGWGVLASSLMGLALGLSGVLFLAISGDREALQKVGQVLGQMIPRR